MTVRPAALLFRDSGGRQVSETFGIRTAGASFPVGMGRVASDRAECRVMDYQDIGHPTSKGVSMRASICIASLALILAAGSLHADGPFLRERKTSDRYQLQPVDGDLGNVISRGGQSRIHLPGPSARALANQLLEQRLKRGDGSGGNVDNLQVIQVDYSDPTDGNVVLLIWIEESPNLSGITVSVLDENGELLVQGNRSGLPGANLPGANSVAVSILPDERLTFMVEGNGDPMSSETEFVILAEQPFADVENFACSEGETNDAGNCDMFLVWDTPAPLPSYHFILLNGDLLGVTASGAIDNVNAGLVNPALLPPGDYVATNLGFLETPEADENLYRGEFVTTNCTLECSDLTCIAPVNLTVCQSGYSAQDDNQLRVTWTNIGSYVGLDVFIDGEISASLSPEDNGEVTELIEIVGGLEPGEHTIGIQAVCEGNEASSLVESTITILESSPHTTPIEGILACEFVPGDPGANPPVPDRTVTTWTNADPSSFFDIWVVDGDQDELYLGATRGDLETITIVNTTPDLTIFLQFFRKTEDGNCYGSDFFFCQPSPPGNIFIRGDCNGSGGRPQITTAVFGLNVLFGGETAPCTQACDTNGDGDVNITDMVRILTFLFGGGAPPAGWLDANTPVCETATDKCETGLASCPF